MRGTKKRIFIISLIILCVLLQGITVFANNYVTLKYSSKGNSVIKLQSALISKGYLNDSADGIYGILTEKAVIKFQMASRITVDGIAGKQTQSTLYNQPVSRGTSNSRNTYATNLYWLSRIINAESESEPYAGKLAVGNVILNRVNSKEFPNSIKDVIFEYYKGIPQFSPVAEGTIYNTPSKESTQAARAVLNGEQGIKYATYFFNPDKSKGSWIVQNKTYVKRIANHVFYK